MQYKHHKKVFYSVLLLSCLSVANGQDPVFSHFFANSLLLNPSMAGVEGPSRIFMGYRNQWPNIGTSYVTYHAAYDRYVEKLHGGIGMRVMNDRQADGAFNAFNLDAMYAYQFQVSRWLHMSGAIQATFGQRSFNPMNLVFGDMINPVNGAISPSMESVNGYSRIYPDFAAGISAFYHAFYGGAAIHHLLRPVITETSDPTGTLHRRFTVHAGAVFPILKRDIGKEIMKVSPNLVFIQQGTVQQINYGVEVVFRDMLAGIWARHDLGFNYGNIIFTAGYQTDKWRFRYSYDIKLSSPTIRLPNMGAHEISLLIIYENLNNRDRYKAIKYPKI
jgi:type IX secretion system PorP/SprF family membrane protein